MPAPSASGTITSTSLYWPLFPKPQSLSSQHPGSTGQPYAGLANETSGSLWSQWLVQKWVHSLAQAKSRMSFSARITQLGRMWDQNCCNHVCHHLLPRACLRRKTTYKKVRSEIRKERGSPVIICRPGSSHAWRHLPLDFSITSGNIFYFCLISLSWDCAICNEES